MKETNEERFTKYFCQYSDDLFLYLVRDLGVERETAIDLMEDVWVVFWEKFHDIRDLKDAQIRKWLWKTAYYKVRNHKRRKNYYSEILYPMEEMEGFYADEEEDDFEREILEECIMALRPVAREVINKRREGKSYRDISFRMNKSIQSLECIYSRAVKKLKSMVGNKLTSFW